MAVGLVILALTVVVAKVAGRRARGAVNQAHPGRVVAPEAIA